MGAETVNTPKTWDILILGGGPAGYTAGMYAARGGMKTLLIEKLVPGGQAATTEWVDNYPGFPEGIAGPELSRKLEEHATRFGLQAVNEEVIDLKLPETQGRPCQVITDQGSYSGWSIIIDDDTRTSLEGIFACGDARKKLLRQIVTACAEGATAAFAARHYVDQLKGTSYD